MFGMLCSELVVGVWSLAQLFYLFSSQCVVSGVNVKRKSRCPNISVVPEETKNTVEVSEGWALEVSDGKVAGRNR